MRLVRGAILKIAQRAPGEFQFYVFSQLIKSSLLRRGDTAGQPAVLALLLNRIPNAQPSPYFSSNCCQAASFSG